MDTEKCAKHGCLNPRRKGQKYCSADCAPLAWYGIEKHRKKISPKPRAKQKIKQPTEVLLASRLEPKPKIKIDYLGRPQRPFGRSYK